MTQELQKSIAYLDEGEKQVVLRFISSLKPEKMASGRERYRREALKEIRQALKNGSFVLASLPQEQ